MGDKGRKKTKTPGIALLNFLMVLMALVLLASAVHLVSEMRSSFVRDHYNSMEYPLKEGDYGEMVYNYYRWHYDTAPFPTPSEEEYHVAAYADAAFRHQLFSAVGDGEMAARCLRQMEQAREKTGSLSVSADEVDRLLENIPLYR